MQRRLAAILAADVVGYSRLMEADESATLAALKDRKRVFEPLVSKHHGRIVKLIGDGVLIEFGSAVEAVQCALDIQRAMEVANEGLPADRAILLRIGVNLGDVVVEGGDLFGDGVNVAARLEELAEPGGICVSAPVQNEVHGRLTIDFEDAGEVALKNLARPVHVFRIGSDTDAIAGRRFREDEKKPSIAVLPLTNMSGDPGQQYFSDGITEDIITELSRFRQLRVVARNSSFRYRGQDVDVVRVGRELGVHYLVEGSIRRLGDRIRITAQLVDAGSGHHVWAERFDCNQDELFTIQDLVVRKIVGTLVGRLEAVGLERAKRKSPASLAAYECVLRADALPMHDTAAEAEKRRLLENAIRLDPGYARAYALLASCFGSQWMDDTSASPDALDRALELARKALELDENDSISHNVLSWVYQCRGLFDLAERHSRRALELNPNRPMVLAGRGSLLVYLGKPEEGIAYLNEAKQLDPSFDPTWYWPAIGVAHFISQRYDDAIAALGRSPNMPYWVQAYLAACCALAAMPERAHDHTAEVLGMRPNFSASWFATKELFNRTADRELLITGLRKAGIPE